MRRQEAGENPDQVYGRADQSEEGEAGELEKCDQGPRAASKEYL